jgi:hypothetical protein
MLKRKWFHYCIAARLQFGPTSLLRWIDAASVSAYGGRRLSSAACSDTSQDWAKEKLFAARRAFNPVLLEGACWLRVRAARPQ